MNELPETSKIISTHITFKDWPVSNTNCNMSNRNCSCYRPKNNNFDFQLLKYIFCFLLLRSVVVVVAYLTIFGEYFLKKIVLATFYF